MNKHRLKKLALAMAVTAGTFAGTVCADANTVDSVLKVGQAKTEDAAQSQKRIDSTASDTQELLQDYRAVNKQIDGLRVYNQRLERQISNQLKRVEEIEGSIEDGTVIRRQITPLVMRRMGGREQLVELDAPFHMGERNERSERQRHDVARSDPP